MKGFKNTGAGLQYVKDFSFPSAQGFSGSAGAKEVKGYMRGGKVKANQKMPANVHKKGGKVTKAAMGGLMGGPEREISVDDVTLTMPKKRGGRAKKSMHDKLLSEGKKMGYASGGKVNGRKSSIGASPDDVGLKDWDQYKKKNTSGEFKMKRGKQDSMDSGVQPARRGKNARSAQQAEAGGTGRLKPGYKKGGKAVKKGVHRVRPSGGGALADAALKTAKRVLRSKRTKLPQPVKASRKGISKNVKARGGMAKC